MIKQVTLVSAVLFGLIMLVAIPAFARGHRVINDNDTVFLRGNVHPLARPEFEVGAMDTSLPMKRMILYLKRNSDKQAKLDKLLAEQQDSASPSYHHWLTPEEFGVQFGPDQDDIDTITDWLISHGFVIDEIAKGRNWINFSGKVPQVERAFHTKMRKYLVNGKLHHANSQRLKIPYSLADLVAGVVSLNDFPLKAMHKHLGPLPSGDIQPSFNDTDGNHYLAPGDFATIYNVNPLYNANINGAGQTIAIVGRTNPTTLPNDWANFRNIFGLPTSNLQVVVNGTDPGDLGADENLEAALDVELSGSVARDANIMFVTSASTFTTDGVTLSAQFIVNHNLAPVMSTSFEYCEVRLEYHDPNLDPNPNATVAEFFDALWAQAAAQGITSFVASGDHGVAGCYDASPAVGLNLLPVVNGLASTPNNVAVGGTQFIDGSGSFWNPANGFGFSSAISYIQELAWNESGATSYCPTGATCAGVWGASGGGASVIYSKPAWQISPGVPPYNHRYVPDVSLAASCHNGYLVTSGCLPNTPCLHVICGTSAAAPSFAGLMALIVQSTGGQDQGNANINFYQLANSQYGSSGPLIFNDITTGHNNVPNVIGYLSNSGYDQVTGLGSVDATALVTNWPGNNLRTLSVTKGGTGSGNVVSSPVGINCGGTCSTPFINGTVVTLFATSDAGSSFAGWSGGGCSGTGSCTVTMDANKAVTANFADIRPTGAVTVNGGATFANSTVVTLNLSATGAGGVSQMQFSNDNVNWSTPEAYATSKNWTLSAGDGTKTVYVKFKDTTGNWSVVINDTIILDTTVPATTATPAGGAYSPGQTVALSTNEPATIYYTTNGTTPTTSSAVYTAPLTISATTTLKFFAKDLTGNSETLKTQTYIIDPNSLIQSTPGTYTHTFTSNAIVTLSYLKGAGGQGADHDGYCSENPGGWCVGLSGNSSSIIYGGTTIATANGGGGGLAESNGANGTASNSIGGTNTTGGGGAGGAEYSGYTGYGGAGGAVTGGSFAVASGTVLTVVVGDIHSNANAGWDGSAGSVSLSWQ